MSSPSTRARTLEELDGRWPPPTTESYLVTTCHRLRSKPLGELSTEDLRILIGQGIGTRHLLPLALDVLEADPLAAGDYYPGDLLRSVLAADPALVQADEWRQRLSGILDAIKALPREIEDAVAAFRRRAT